MADPPRLLFPDPTRRFKCECGMVSEEGGAAIEHTMHQHKVAIEEFRNGQWRYALGVGSKDLMLMIVERLRMRGENVEGVIRRINEMAEAAQAQGELSVRDRDN